MDVGRFSESKAGRLFRIPPPENVAFVPDPLPRSRATSGEVVDLLLTAVQELGKLDGAGQHVATPELILRPLRNREALKSSSLEGTYATPQELLLFEFSASPRGDSVASVKEVHNYASAMQLGLELLDEIPFCLRLIRRLHARLLEEVRGRDKSPGAFRRVQVHIGSDRRFVPPPPEQLPDCLDELEKVLNEPPKGIHPLLWAFMVHYQFETIHPFVDGNGRVGRLLLALMIARQCKLEKPWLYMSAWFDRHKDEYIDLMFNVSARGAWEPWLLFCLRGTIDQAQDARARLDNLIALEKDYQRRVAGSGFQARLAGIVDRFFSIMPITDVPTIARVFDVTYPTARKDLERLRDLGIVTLLDGRPMLYFAEEIARVGVADPS